MSTVPSSSTSSSSSRRHRLTVITGVLVTAALLPLGAAVMGVLWGDRFWYRLMDLLRHLFR